MASAASNQAIPAAVTQIFDGSTEGGGATTFMIRCLSTGQDLLVRLDGLHEATDWFPIAGGNVEYFRLNNMGIQKVYAQGVGGVANIDYGVVSKTVNV